MTADAATGQLNLSAGWQGSLELEFAFRDRATHLSYSRSQAPLKLQRPFYPEGPEVCHCILLHTAGGVVGDDRLSLNLRLQPQAHALITSAAATKVYRSNGLVAQQTAQVQIAEGACCEWLPQETIVFDGANYQQNLRVELAPNATWIGWEITRLGRSARGEQFLSGNWRSRTEVWRQDQPLWIDPQWIPGSPVIVNSPHGLAGHPVIASFALVGKAVELELITQARSLWQAGAYPGEAGVTSLTEGLLCRYRGPSSQAARSWFMQVWQLLRQLYLGRSACPPRVWQI
ncbi:MULTISPECIES: urease accessory protein UreD [Trichocoleus]|uniref:Urease accessory protein UreD n=1 Tax=Trichocoleus desertorum GB2-A4 TaxID=2933944 RepID=A0ABV0J940_9CYAN|nr:urease accessory protein UreD [Trichocoleus sp. FACHB-46]MBD1861153.1 urease accessory protein UreD [Trichocoleus sp. FACHB-46]